jgi:hypothetical protein
MKKFISNLTALWNWFDGKKTAIGATILVVAPYITDIANQFVQGIWHIPAPAWVAQIVASLIYIGTGLTKIGLIHKAAKAADALTDTLTNTKSPDYIPTKLDIFAKNNNMTTEQALAKANTDTVFAQQMQDFLKS